MCKQRVDRTASSDTNKKINLPIYNILQSHSESKCMATRYSQRCTITMQSILLITAK